MAGTIIVTDESFAGEVLGSDKPVLLHFWATWCGPCRVMASKLDDIADQHGDTIVIAKLDVDENPGMAAKFDVKALPTMILFHGGKTVQRITDALPEVTLLQRLNDYV
jgi:thioredoxin 1